MGLLDINISIKIIVKIENDMKRQRLGGNKHNALITIVGLLAVITAVALLWNPVIKPFANDAFNLQLAGIPVPGEPTPEEEAVISGQCQAGPDAPTALDKAWKLTLNKNTGGNVGTSTDTVIIYDSKKALYEDNLDPSSGVVTTGNVYKSGATYNILYNNSNTQQWFNDIAVPFHCVDTDSNHFTDLVTYAIGTYVYTITWSGNTTATESGGTYNYTTQGTTPTFTVKIENTADNTGIIGSYNPITQRDYKPVLLIVLNGTGFDTGTMKSTQFNQDQELIVPQFKETVTKRIWSIELTEDNLSREVAADGTVIKSGTTSVTFQLNLAGVSVDTVDMYVQLAAHTSNNEISQFGSATTNDGVTLKDHLVNIKS